MNARADTDSGTVRIAALGDLHVTPGSAGLHKALFQQIGATADLLLLCGDLTDHGLADEARVLASELQVANKVPVIAVLGNHDFESGQQGEVTKILRDAGVQILDGDAVEANGIGFAGVKGFGGGFGRGTLSAFGEGAVKQFVQEAINEAMKLEAALLRLRTPTRIALLHYSPIQQTVENEPPIIFPFLGCSRLEEPLNRYTVSAIVHGHAHKGTLEGKTATGTPVFNVALPLLRQMHPDRPPFRMLELPAQPPSAEGAPPTQEPVTSRVS